MPASTQIRRLAAIFGFFLPTLATLSSSRVRSKLARKLGLKGGSGFWRALTVVFALLNFKTLPWAWHFRIFRGIIYQIWFQRIEIHPRDLFYFLVTKSHASLWETDYNLHKSNSTYFADLDVARTHLVAAILRRGILGVGTRPGEESTTWAISSAAQRSQLKPFVPPTPINPFGASGIDTAGSTGASTPRIGRGMTEDEFMAVATQPGNLLVALGSVACWFHREIPPYRSYEIWTRLLTWDRKWMYFVSYFVEPGALKPEEFVLQPWRNRRSRQSTSESLEERKKRIRRKIFATSIATYVVKKGRLTIPPEVVLQRSQMLPEKPPGAPSTFFTPSQSSGSSSGGGSPTANQMAESALHTDTTVTDDGSGVPSVLVESLFPEAGDGEDRDAPWTWEMVERERRRGLRFAQAFDGLNALRDEFDGGGGRVLGSFSDFAAGF